MLLSGPALRALGMALLLSGLVGSVAGAQPSETSRVLRATRIDGDRQPTIDGQLDDPIWAEAHEADDFVERRPVQGAIPPVRTAFRVLFDREALYVGIRLEMAEGEEARAVELARDSLAIFSDDAVTVKVDVRHDHRNTVGFTVNSAGAQLDYIAIDNGRVFRREVDAVWESAVTEVPGAWIAEMRLPFTALGLADVVGERVVGLNITRDHNAARGTYDWAAMPVQLGAFSAQHYGDLLGLDDVETGRPLILLPYVLGGLREDDPTRFPSGTPWTVSAGMDARMRLAEDVWGELTALTDFAQVDLDTPQVNLDRFPLFFPERRPFFLNGLDVFTFGAEGQAQPFFTRRIGLDQDRSEVLIWGGAKAYGRVPLGGSNRLTFGVLDVLTDEDPITNYGVGRLRLDLGEASYIGAIATVRTPGDQRNDVTAGADFFVRAADGKLELSGFASGSFGPEDPSDDPDAPPPGIERGAAGRLAARYRGRVARAEISGLWVGPDFDPAVGFVRRQDTVQLDAELTLQRRTDAMGLENVDVIFRGAQLFDSTFDTHQGSRGGAEIALGWVSGWYAYARADYVEDVVFESFDLAGRTVQPGTYRGLQTFFGISRSDARNPYFSLDYDAVSSYFGGVRQTASASFGVTATRHVRLVLSGALSHLELPSYDPFFLWTANARLTVAPTTTLQLDAIFQVDAVAEVTGTLVRLRWRYLPGSDLFLVYRERRPYGDTRGDPDQALERRALLKLIFRFDALL